MKLIFFQFGIPFYSQRIEKMKENTPSYFFTRRKKGQFIPSVFKVRKNVLNYFFAQ